MTYLRKILYRPVKSLYWIRENWEPNRTLLLYTNQLITFLYSTSTQVNISYMELFGVVFKNLHGIDLRKVLLYGVLACRQRIRNLPTLKLIQCSAEMNKKPITISLWTNIIRCVSQGKIWPLLFVTKRKWKRKAPKKTDGKIKTKVDDRITVIHQLWRSWLRLHCAR